MISINNTMKRFTGRGAITTLKRSRPGSSSGSSFDMGDFIKASQQVEETIAFPSIEWPSFDDDSDDSSSSSSNTSISDFDNSCSRSSRTRQENEDDEGEYGFSSSPRKRQCRGLIRCDRSCNLTSLWEMAITSERRGSNGSLSWWHARPTTQRYNHQIHAQTTLPLYTKKSNPFSC